MSLVNVSASYTVSPKPIGSPVLSQGGMWAQGPLPQDYSEQQALEIALIENLQRKDLTAFEEADGYRTLIEKYDYTHEQVGEAVGRSRVTVTETLRLLKIPETIRDSCRHADITAKGILLEIAKAPNEEMMKQLIAEIIEDRLDRSEIRRRRAELDAPER